MTLKTNLEVPFLERKRMSDCKPITMDFEVGRVARRMSVSLAVMFAGLSYYAGHNSTLSAAATTAVCVRVG
jgi:hypothetical protein